MSKKTKLEFHKVANIFPMMNDSERTSLVHDISINGLREPIWLYDGKIIDGRNRYLACIETGTEPQFKVFEGKESDLIDFVISLNLHRRHLTTSQKACLAVDLLPTIELRTKENLSKKMSAIRTNQKDVAESINNLNSSQTASKIFGISERYIFDAKKLLKESEVVFNDVRSGKLSLQQAKKQLNQIEVSAILQKPNLINETNNSEVIQLSKNDYKKINELITELGISESKAKDYILKLKSNRKPKKLINNHNSSEYKELKIRIPQEDKDKLQSLAKQQHISIAELMRKIIYQIKND